MADIPPLKLQSTTDPTKPGEFTTGDTVPIASGGTGATTAAAARTNLGVAQAGAFDPTIAGQIGALTEKVTPDGADVLLIEDSAASGAKKYLQIANFPAGAIGDNTITNAKLADVSSGTVKGRVTAASGDPEDLTPAQVRTLLNVADGATANPNALETDQSGEIAALTEKVAPVAGDHILIEDSEASNAKKRVLVSNLPTGAPADDSVTNAKLANMATATIKGRNTAGTGDPEDLSAATVRTILNVANNATSNPNAVETDQAGEISALTEKTSPVAGDHLLIEDSAAGNVKKRVQVGNLPAGTPADDSITNAKLANVATQTLKGRTTAGTGDPEDLTAAQARTLLNVEDGATADQTAADIRGLGFFDTSNDGAGSGLDADLLDGNQASAFATASGLSTHIADTANPHVVTAAQIGNATASAIGCIELATQGEVDAGTDTVRAVTPASLRGTTVNAPSSTPANDADNIPRLDSAGELDTGFLNKTDVGDSLPFPTYPGREAFTGSGAPADGTGKVGDFYIDYASGSVWEKTATAETFPDSTPNFSSVDYTPSDVATSNANQRASIWLPSGSVPTDGFPWILYSSNGSFQEGGPGTSITETSFVGMCLSRGIAIVWVGLTGNDTSTNNFFWEPGSTGFDSYSATHFFPEKDAIWALQFFKENAATYSLDPDRVGIHGISSGGQSVAWGPLGTDETFTGSDPMLAQSFAVQAAVLFEVPTWWNAYEGTTAAPIAPHFRNASNTRASDLNDATDATLKEASLDFRVRETGANIQTTPIFMTYDEPLKSENFTRSSGDPALTNTLSIATELHSSWFGYTLIGGIVTQSTNRLDESVFYVKRGNQYQSGSHNAIAQFGAEDPQPIDAAVRFMEWQLKPGLWVNRGMDLDLANIENVTGPTTIGRASGTGAPVSLGSDGTLAVAWFNRAANVMLAKDAAGTSLLEIAVGTNSIIGRSGSSDIGSKQIAAGQIPYNNEANAGLNAANIEDALYDALGSPAAPYLLGRPATSTSPRGCAGDEVLAIAWSQQTTPYTMHAKNAAGTAVLPFTVGTNALVGRSNGSTVGSLAIGAGQVAYNNEANAGIAATNIEAALADAGGPSAGSVTLAALEDTTGPTLLGRLTGTGATTSQSADNVLAISLASRTANQMVSKNNANTLPNAFTVGTNSIVGRGSGEVLAASLSAGQILYRPLSGDLAPTDLKTAAQEVGTGYVDVVLGSDFSTSNASNDNVTGFKFTPAANTSYVIHGRLLVTTTATATGPRPGIAWPSAGVTQSGGNISAPNSVTTSAQRWFGGTGTASAASTGLPDTTNSYFVDLEALLVMGASPTGDFQITLGSETATVSVSMKAGSFISYRKVG